jgi:hypothetical protein
MIFDGVHGLGFFLFPSLHGHDGCFLACLVF